jgi:hypothetical protein
VGGPYGETHTFDSAEELQLRAAPGSYKILLPQFDVVKSRWDATIQPKTTTRVAFSVNGQEVTKTGESKTPIESKKDAPPAQ